MDKNQKIVACVLMLWNIYKITQQQEKELCIFLKDKSENIIDELFSLLEEFNHNSSMNIQDFFYKTEKAKRTILEKYEL